MSDSLAIALAEVAKLEEVDIAVAMAAARLAYMTGYEEGASEYQQKLAKLAGPLPEEVV